jgi:hyperosmotically inducible protein
MKPAKFLFIGVIVVIAATLACNEHKAPDVTGEVRRGLDQAGLNDVKVSQDRDKGVVTLSGNVPTDDDKSRAESIARPIVGSEVVANEIGVRPNGDQSAARRVDSDLDSGINKNLDAMLIQHRLKNDVHYDVNNGVVTLKGDVPSETQRTSVEKLAQQVPNVKQVVNELEVRNRKATSTK